MSKRIVEQMGRTAYPYASVRDGGGPVRVFYDDHPDPNFKRRPAGFLADIEPVAEKPEVEPLLWSGDQA